MKEQRTIYLDSLEYNSPWNLAEVIAELLAKLHSVSPEYQHSTVAEFSSYETADNSLTIIVDISYERLETDGEEQAREEATVRRQAEQERRLQEEKTERERRLMKQIEKMSAEEKQGFIALLQQAKKGA